MNKDALINQITPLYNKYKSEKTTLSPTDAVKIMWDMGDCLHKFIQKTKIKPHTLYREIYGKSEGAENIAQKSYITREFQGRCYRIRNIFSTKTQIDKEIGKLNNFTAFREAMPFFDNPSYKLEGNERNDLLKLLNSKLKSATLLKRIREMQSKIINKKNPRTQKLHELEEMKLNFIEFYNAIYGLFKIQDYDKARTLLKGVEDGFVQLLANRTDSLTQEGLQLNDLEIPEGLDETWKKYTTNAQYLLTQKDAKVRRRFRRIIKAERIARLADMLIALTSKKSYEGFR